MMRSEKPAVFAGHALQEGANGALLRTTVVRSARHEREPGSTTLEASLEAPREQEQPPELGLEAELAGREIHSKPSIAGSA